MRKEDQNGLPEYSCTCIGTIGSNGTDDLPIMLLPHSASDVEQTVGEIDRRRKMAEKGRSEKYDRNAEMRRKQNSD